MGAGAPSVQRLQFFLSESTWDAGKVNDRRLEMLREQPETAPRDGGAIVIDDSGDRKDGTATAHVGRQWLGPTARPLERASAAPAWPWAGGPARRESVTRPGAPRSAGARLLPRRGRRRPAIRCPLPWMAGRLLVLLIPVTQVARRPGDDARHGRSSGFL
ncbi:transposase [Streptomyces sp. CT34]|uniref:transposase n=1 Tax=Streptomyces sp. CT34 TaxID=1553907 RepID=UPI000A7221B3|nr:transposase [Streptomyces sp. CT34]